MSSSDVDRAADFVRRFEAYWAAPSTEGLAALLAPDVRLEAPAMPTTNTLAEGQESFDALFALIPDLTATVQRWGATDDGVLIEFTFTATLPAGARSWSSVDRFVIGDDGLATERVGYFDPTPLLAALSAD